MVVVPEKRSTLGVSSSSQHVAHGDQTTPTLSALHVAAARLFQTHTRLTHRIIKAVAWLTVLGIYILYLVSQTDTRGAYNTHAAVAHVLRLGELESLTSQGLHNVVTYVRVALIS